MVLKKKIRESKIPTGLTFFHVEKSWHLHIVGSLLKSVFELATRASGALGTWATHQHVPSAGYGVIDKTNIERPACDWQAGKNALGPQLHQGSCVPEGPRLSGLS